MERIDFEPMFLGFVLGFIAGCGVALTLVSLWG